MTTFTTADRPEGSRAAIYAELASQFRSLVHGEQDAIANAANLAGLLNWGLADLNWAGFYIVRAGELVLGPFQGKPACIRIAFGKGVCGTAAATGQTQIVPDVHAFPGHIACDAASRSELVIPLILQWSGCRRAGSRQPRTRAVRCCRQGRLRGFGAPVPRSQ